MMTAVIRVRNGGGGPADPSGPLFFPRYFLALLARFRQADRDRLLAALDLAGSAGATAFCGAAFIAVHLAFTSVPVPREYLRFLRFAICFFSNNSVAQCAYYDF